MGCAASVLPLLFCARNDSNTSHALQHRLQKPRLLFVGSCSSLPARFREPLLLPTSLLTCSLADPSFTLVVFGSCLAKRRFWESLHHLALACGKTRQSARHAHLIWQVALLRFGGAVAFCCLGQLGRRRISPASQSSCFKRRCLRIVRSFCPGKSFAYRFSSAAMS